MEALANNCSVLTALFIGAICGTIVANLAGILAWRDRREGLGPWEWMTNPTAFWRGSNFKRPYAPARLLCASLSLLTGIAVMLLAASLIQMQRAGATSVCGYSF